MASESLRMTVKWESKRNFPSGTYTIHNRDYEISPAEDIPDIQVFDATQWDSFEQSRNRFTVYNCPNLVICNETSAAKWLNFLSEFDGICLEKDVEKLLPMQILRVCLRNEERKALVYNSRIDQLTGLFNRKEMYRQMEMEMESLSIDNPLSILVIDMDRFKLINDNYGHRAGDMVLQEVSSIIRKAISFTPRAFRFGGEEFIILMRMNETQAVALGEFIRKEVEQYQFQYEEVDFNVTVSLGINTVICSSNLNETIEKADRALYEAKSKGRNQVVNYSDYLEEMYLDDTDPEIKDFENRIKVLTERLTNTLTTKSKKLMSQIKTEADKDGLTGLFVRKYFDKRISREYETARNKDRDLSLIFIDVDHFGMVNKTYGFPTGDQALRIVSKQIHDSIRNVDWAARYGGEEICIILPDTNEDEACEIAERIWNNIGRQHLKAFDGRNFRITASLGVAEVRPDDSDLDAFIQRTSDRTRRAKENGRNQICREDRGIDNVPI